MTTYRFARSSALSGAVALLGAFILLAATSAASAASILSGFVYVDRNNDGQLAFNNEPLPELVLSNVEVRLFNLIGPGETLQATTLTDNIGRYEFSGLGAGTYAIRQTQPTGFIDGIETAGLIRDLVGNIAPPGSNVGTVGAEAFVNIVLPNDARGDLYNFGERGLAPGFVSKRFLLGTAPPPQFAPPPDIIPEPSTLLLGGLAALGGIALRRRAASRIESM